MSDVSKTLSVVFLVLILASLVWSIIVVSNLECKVSIDKCYNIIPLDTNKQVTCLGEFDYSDKICIEEVNEFSTSLWTILSVLGAFVILCWFLSEFT